MGPFEVDVEVGLHLRNALVPLGGAQDSCSGQLFPDGDLSLSLLQRGDVAVCGGLIFCQYQSICIRQNPLF